MFKRLGAPLDPVFCLFRPLYPDEPATVRPQRNEGERPLGGVKFGAGVVMGVGVAEIEDERRLRIRPLPLAGPAKPTYRRVPAVRADDEICRKAAPVIERYLLHSIAKVRPVRVAFDEGNTTG